MCIFGKISFLRATLKSNTDVSVDFLFADDDFKKEALRRKETVNIDDFSINISAPEDLIILKLLSGRDQDELDAGTPLSEIREPRRMMEILIPITPPVISAVKPIKIIK